MSDSDDDDDDDDGDDLWSDSEIVILAHVSITGLSPIIIHIIHEPVRERRLTFEAAYSRSIDDDMTRLDIRSK